MKRLTLLSGVLGLVLTGAMAVQAAEAPEQGLFKMKAGACKFVILDSRGVTPMAGTALELTSPVDGKVLIQASSDQSGVCTLDVAAGRYVVRVHEMDLAVLDATAGETLSECRIVVPDAAVMVGGQEGTPPPTEQGSKKKGAAWWSKGSKLTPFVVGGVVVLAAGGGYLVYDNNNNDNNNDETPLAAPAPIVRTTPLPVSR